MINKLTVIIPCYNREKTIRDAVLSILIQQGLDEIQMIVVDDGSTDKSMEVISDLPVEIFKTEGRTGACHARNVGIQHAKHEWIAFNDSDDIWLPSKIIAMNTLLEKGDYDWLGHRFMRLISSKKIVESPTVEPGAELTQILKKNFISTQCMVIKRTVLDELGGFDESYKRFQDWELGIRLCEKYKFGFLNEFYALCFEQDDSISKNFQKGIDSRKKLLEKHKLIFNKHTMSKLSFIFDIKVRQAAGLIRK